VYNPSEGSRLVREGRSGRFMFPYLRIPRGGAPPFQQAASVFSVQTCLKAQIFEVIPPTPVNMANADRASLNTRFVTQLRTAFRSFRLARGSIRPAAVLSTYARRSARKRNAEHSLTFGRACVSINSAAVSSCGFRRRT